MGFEDLSDIHPRRHAERVQNDIHRRSVLKERHVFHGRNFGNHTLVAVTASHFVARLQLSLHRDEDFDHLHDAWRQFVAALELVDFVVKARLKTGFRCVKLFLERFDFGHRGFVGDGDFPPLTFRELLLKNVLCDRPALKTFRSCSCIFAKKQWLETAVNIALKDREFVVAVFGKPFNFLTLDGNGAFVLIDAVTVKYAHFNDRTGNARMEHVSETYHLTSAAFSPKMARSKPFFWSRVRAFALRSNLTNQDVARASLLRR